MNTPNQVFRPINIHIPIFNNKKYHKTIPCKKNNVDFETKIVYISYNSKNEIFNIRMIMQDTRKKAYALYRTFNVLTEALFRQTQSFFSSEMAKYNATEINVWKILGIMGQRKMRDISDMLNIPNSTTTTIVDRMVKNDIVRRYRSEDDRRVVFISLTAKGEKLWKSALDQFISIYEYMLSLLDEKDQDEIVRLFNKMTEKYLKDKEGQKDIVT